LPRRDFAAGASADLSVVRHTMKLPKAGQNLPE
jgi:hypothetical protein